MSLIDFHLCANTTVITRTHAPHRCSHTGKGPVTTVSPDGQHPCQGSDWHPGTARMGPEPPSAVTLTTIPGLDLIRDTVAIWQVTGLGSLLILPGQLTGNISPSAELC